MYVNILYVLSTEEGTSSAIGLLLKSAYQKINFLISKPKQCYSSFEYPKYMFKLMGKKIFTILRSKILFI